MATDLFGKYYNNPTKAEIYTSLLCNGASADEISFDIVDSEGTITDNADTLASIDLSDVHVTMSQYTSDMKIIEPYSYIYIKGMTFGDTLMSKSYGHLNETMTSIEGWEYHTSLIFLLAYIENGNKITKSIKIESDYINDVTFIDATNDYFRKNNVQIECSYNNGYITFDSTSTGYEFWINHFIVLYENNDNENTILQTLNDWIISNNKLDQYAWNDDTNLNDEYKGYIEYNIKNNDDVNKFCYMMKDFNNIINEYISIHNINKEYILEDISKYIGSKKYKNGAMKGIVLKTTYPEFNNDSIYEYQESLKMVHISDRVEKYVDTHNKSIDGTSLYTKKIFDVIDTYQPLYESFHNTCDCICTNCTNNQTQSELDIINVMGLEDFCRYATEQNMWSTIGQVYIRTTTQDDDSIPSCKNLLPSFILYNPNPFPVVIKYLTFA